MQRKWFPDENGEFFDLEKAISVREMPAEAAHQLAGLTIRALPRRLVVWFGDRRFLNVKGDEQIKRVKEFLQLRQHNSQPPTSTA
jgi:hypothetical protein